MSKIDKIKVGDVSYEISDSSIPEIVRNITEEDINNWNNSGSVEIDDSTYLKYKGHVDNETDLPEIGQPSGVVGTTSVKLKSSFNDTSIPLDNLGSLSPSLKYYVCLNQSSTTSSNSRIFIETDYPEVIHAVVSYKQGNKVENATKGYLGFYIEYNPNKPVYVQATGSSLYCPRRIYTNASGVWTQKSAGSGAITRSVVNANSDYIIMPYGNGNVNGWTYGGSLIYDTDILMKSNIPTIYYKYIDLGMSTDALSYSVRQYNKDAYYNDGMAFLMSDVSTGQLFFTKLGQVGVNLKRNDVYTVGENNDVYIVNQKEEWEKISSSDDKQDKLISGSNIKTINYESILGSGNIDFKTINGEYVVGSGDISFKTINGESIVGDGDITVEGGSGDGAGVTFYRLDEIIPDIYSMNFDASIDGIYEFPLYDGAGYEILQNIVQKLLENDMCGLIYQGSTDYGQDCSIKMIKTKATSGTFNGMYVEYDGQPIQLSDLETMPDLDYSKLFACPGEYSCTFTAIDMVGTNDGIKPVVFTLTFKVMMSYDSGMMPDYSTVIKMIVKKYICEEGTGGSGGGGGVTTEEMNDAINEAIYGALEGTY